MRYGSGNIVRLGFFNTFIDFSDNVSWILMKKKSDLDKCVKFAADPNTHLDLVNLNMVSSEDCWALVEIQTEECSSECFISKHYLVNTTKHKTNGFNKIRENRLFFLTCSNIVITLLYMQLNLSWETQKIKQMHFSHSPVTNRNSKCT